MALNVALYGAAGKRWTMTERGSADAERSADTFSIGPSRLRWHGDALTIDIDEVGMPLPMRVRGRVRVQPQGPLSTFSTALDDGGRHRWGPIAPCSRVDVEMTHPAARWSGHAYLDSNEGDEPIDVPFSAWDWSRARLSDGSTAVLYDVRCKNGGDRLIAQRFRPDGSLTSFDAPPRQQLPKSAVWRLPRATHSASAQPPAGVVQTLEDTPFYVRSLLDSSLLGERVTAVHETLIVPRVVSLPVQWMLPWRMPRRASRAPG